VAKVGSSLDQREEEEEEKEEEEGEEVEEEEVEEEERGEAVNIIIITVERMKLNKLCKYQNCEIEY